MKKTYIIIAISLVLITIAGLYLKKRFYEPKAKLNQATSLVNSLTQANLIKEGDLIFQTSLSAQSKVIQKATGSKYSHCGIIFKNSDSLFVFEAVQPVKYTPLAKWIARGANSEFVLKRLKNYESIISPQVISKMKKISGEYKGKNYDLTFEWSDDKIYCSELIWKIYKRATGIEIGKLQKLKEFDLSDPQVKQIMKQRYGDKIPFEEIVISPVSVFNSEMLITINTNN